MDGHLPDARILLAIPDLDISVGGEILFHQFLKIKEAVNSRNMKKELLWLHLNLNLLRSIVPLPVIRAVASGFPNDKYSVNLK